MGHQSLPPSRVIGYSNKGGYTPKTIPPGPSRQLTGLPRLIKGEALSHSGSTGIQSIADNSPVVPGSEPANREGIAVAGWYFD